MFKNKVEVIKLIRTRYGFGLIGVFIWLSYTNCYAQVTPANDKIKVRDECLGCRELTADEAIAYRQTHPQREETADEKAEWEYARNNIIINAQGRRELKPEVTGKRYVISSREVVNEQGQIEGIPTNAELVERQSQLEAVREHNRQAFANAGLQVNKLVDPEAKRKQIEANQVLKEFGDNNEKSEQARIDQWVQDKKEYAVKVNESAYDYKALVSYETQNRKE